MKEVETIQKFNLFIYLNYIPIKDKVQNLILEKLQFQSRNMKTFTKVYTLKGCTLLMED